jgi:hypothetical protein
MFTDQAKREPCPRGVYILPWRAPGGERYLAAVDRRGVRVLEAMVPPSAKKTMERTLWTLLDEDDPTPRPLKVVR